MITSVSVITYVYNKNKELSHFLRGLRKSGFDDELVVVVIGGEDPFELFDESDPFSVKIFYMEKHSKLLPIGQAKNIGSSMAQGEALVFLDASQTPSKELIPAYLAALGQYPEAIHVGRTAQLKKTPHKNWTFAYLSKNASFPVGEPGAKRRHMQNLPGPNDFKGSNFALKKQTFIDLGGFDENYKGVSADMDFCYKAAQKEAQMKYNHFALAYEFEKPIRTRPKKKLEKNLDLDSFIDNSTIFFSKWGHFPSRKILKDFQKRGLLRLDEKLGTIERAN